MFSHIFVTRLKCIVRDRQMMFWTLLFPILLSLMFHVAFSNIGKSETFQKSSIAVVSNAEFQKTDTFKTALTYITKDDKSTGAKDYFDVTYCDRTKAESLLKDGKIIGYINFDNGPKIYVKDTGINQTILNQFLNNYLQTVSAAKTIVKENPAAIRNFTENSKSEDYLKSVSPSKSNPDETLNYYYALIAMACLYGGMFGLKEVEAVQANQTPQGARVNLAPVHKMKVFACSLCAATLVQFTAVLVLIAFLAFVLKIDFGGKVAFLLLACVASCFTGVSFGAAISALVKNRTGLKLAILITGTIILSFLSGLMFEGMKYIVQTNAPIIAYLNPANAITDAFYSLYYYDTYTRFFTNIALLFGFTAVFYLITYFVMRRQRYESI